ncbi:DUF4249 domain-containing protein [Spirosoma rhododendri]|uniref:DUF4249 domain-containing protein n=1 Tax=Spirosoma rhododendri TaxID=2728024 RepID=A0A7L5DID0_9BACT|nr:DUF4249 domain-containing protein [Spirosoma rhododendri]QJD77805.1 DUF4249 domain-containing protein [Spirosoma rhododendri]
MRHPAFLHWFIFLSGLLLAGCGSLRTEISPDQLGLESAKLVVTGFLSPQDTVLAVKLTQSRTVLGDSISASLTDGNVTSATVTLGDGSRSVRLRYMANGLPYYSVPAGQLPIITGRTYTLNVNTAEGQRASATCTIPAPVSLSAVQVDSLMENNRTRRYFVRTTWQDPAGQPNYYQAIGTLQMPVSRTATTNSTTVSGFTYTNLNFDDDFRGLRDDSDVDGTTLTSGRAFLGNVSVANAVGFRQQFSGSRVAVSLLAVDAAYYQYRSAVIRQGRVRGNPFAEPVLIPSNITGGLGCFSGYNSSTIGFTVN